MTTNKQIHADKLIEFIDNHTDWHTRIKNDLKGFINSVSSTPLESESLKESAINQISHYQVKVDELNKQLSEFTNQILEQNKQIEELKGDLKTEKLGKSEYFKSLNEALTFIEKQNSEIGELKKELKTLKAPFLLCQIHGCDKKNVDGMYCEEHKNFESQLSQSGSKSGYEELLEWIDERFKGEIHDAETTRMILCFKDKILSLSSNKESKGREIKFAEWVDGNYNKESDDEYILKEDLRIIYKEEDEEVYTIKQLYLKFQSLPPSTSKVEAKPEAGIEAENIGSNYQTAKPSIQEGEKKTAGDVLELETRNGETLVAKLRNALSPHYGLPSVILKLRKNPKILGIVEHMANRALENNLLIDTILNAMEYSPSTDSKEAVEAKPENLPAINNNLKQIKAL